MSKFDYSPPPFCLFPFTSTQRTTKALGVAVLLLAGALVSSFGQSNRTEKTAKQVATKDPQAVSILSQALTALGSARPDLEIKDFQAAGKMTFYWAGDEVTGALLVKGTNQNQLRLDTSLPEGTRSLVINKLKGQVVEPTGKVNKLPYHNAINLGLVMLPLMRISSAMVDPAFEIRYAGLVTTTDQRFQKVQLRKSSLRDDPEQLAKLEDFDVLLDSSFHVVAVQDQTHPPNTSTEDIPHSVYFSDFRSVNGINVPFSIVERIAGQRVASIQLNNIQLNVNISQSEFEF